MAKEMCVLQFPFHTQNTGDAVIEARTFFSVLLCLIILIVNGNWPKLYTCQ